MASAAGILQGRFGAPKNPLGKFLHQAENKIGMLKNANYIAELHRIPCGVPDPWLIIKTGLQSAPPALLSLELPGCNDIVKTKLGLSPWHAKTIKSVLRKAAAPEALTATKFLYKVGYFTAEKYLWWWQVAEVTVEFITTWESLIYQEQQCQLPGAGTAYGTFGPLVYTEGFPSYALWIPTKGHPGVAFGVGRITIVPGYEATVGYTMGFQGWPDPSVTSPVTTWWEELSDVAVNDVAHAWGGGPDEQTQTGGSWYYKDPGAITPKVYRIGVEVEGPNKMQLVNGSFNIGFTGRHQGNTTFGCKLPKVEWPFPNPLL